MDYGEKQLVIVNFQNELLVPRWLENFIYDRILVIHFLQLIILLIYGSYQ